MRYFLHHNTRIKIIWKNFNYGVKRVDIHKVPSSEPVTQVPH